MAEENDFRDRELRDAVFEHVDLTGARFHLSDLTGARMHNVDLTRARLTGLVLEDAVVDGALDGLVLNGVEVLPLIEAELDRRYPDRALMRPADVAGFRAAWERLCELWDDTVTRAAALEERAPGIVHERVGGEWSFVETLRHLLFVTDAWVLRTLLHDPAPYHRLTLPHEESQADPAVPWDPDARPTLTEVVEARRDRRDRVSAVLRELTDERLAERTEPVGSPGFPPPDAYPVAIALRGVLSEGWEHRLFALRDLDALEARLDAAAEEPGA